MSSHIKLEPIHRPNDNELIGFIRRDENISGLWYPLTIFGYPLSTSLPKKEAVRYLLENGLEVLMDTWQFYNAEDEEWYNCLILEAKPNLLTIKISDYGHPDIYSILTIEHPTKLKIRRLERE